MNLLSPYHLPTTCLRWFFFLPKILKHIYILAATTLDNTNRPIQDAFDKTLADAFAYGSGHVRPDLAIDPGLVYDLSLTDYLNFLCASGYDQQLISALNFNRTFICSGSHSVNDLNYPSITLPNLRLKPVTIARTVTNVGPPSTYTVSTRSPNGYSIAVVPPSLTFTKIGERKTFKVIVQASSAATRRKYEFGDFRWTDGKHIVRSSITVKRRWKFPNWSSWLCCIVWMRVCMFRYKVVGLYIARIFMLWHNCVVPWFLCGCLVISITV